MRIKPFQALRPPPELAHDVASVPYDVITSEEARSLAARKPLSFLHVVRPEIDLPPDADIYSDAAYLRARENLERFYSQGVLQRDDTPALYVYRMQMGSHSQTGVVACLNVQDVTHNVIRRHETTREDKLRDRTRLIDTLSAHSGPVLMTFRDRPVLNELLAGVEADADPLYDFESHFQVRHTVWRVPRSSPLIDAFAAVDAVYVADGHHRLEAACRVAAARRSQTPDTPRTEPPDAEADWFMAVLFPAGRMRVLPYNRCVADLNGLDTTRFLQACAERFEPADMAPGCPAAPGELAMYLDGEWHGLHCPEDRPGHDDPVASLDVSYLQDALLEPVLGIHDPRRDHRIDFIGGLHSRDEVRKRVDSGAAAVGFCLYPVSVDQIMSVADAGRIMPPKSTWFEPKLKSGLLVHTF